MTNVQLFGLREIRDDKGLDFTNQHIEQLHFMEIFGNEKDIDKADVADLDGTLKMILQWFVNSYEESF